MDQEGLMFPKTQKKRKKRMKHPRSILHEKNGTYERGKTAFLYKRKGILFRINLKQIKRILETNCLDATSGVL